MPTALITGSNRGLGLEWTRQLAEAGWRVFATCRHPGTADDLARLAERHDDVHVHALDVTRQDQIAALAETLAREPIDWLINNAGVFIERWDRDPLGRIDYDDWEETLRVNLLGHVRVTEAFVGHLARSDRKLVLAISSHMGSIADITAPRSYAYRSSKAALNAAMKGMTYELADHGVGLLMLHPGWARTRMGGEQAPIPVEESVAGMRRLAEGFTPGEAGRFYRFDGREMPW